MVKSVTAIKMRQNLGQVLNETYYGGNEFVVKRAGKPIAAIIPIDEFEQWEKNRSAFFKSIREIQSKNKSVPPAKIEKSITEAVKAVRSSRTK